MVVQEMDVYWKEGILGEHIKNKFKTWKASLASSLTIWIERNDKVFDEEQGYKMKVKLVKCIMYMERG
jgi:hypothetical protein